MRIRPIFLIAMASFFAANACGADVPEPPHASEPPSDAECSIVFTRYSRSTEARSIVKVEPDGTKRTLRPNGFSPLLSPDCTRIVFLTPHPQRETDLWVMNAAGSDASMLARGPIFYDGGFGWHPDSERLVYSRAGGSEASPAGLYIIDADGDDERLLKDGRNEAAVGLDVSPDGRSIVYSATRHATDRCCTRDVFLLDIESGDVGQLTDVPERESADQPTWAPDGDSIAYVSTVDARTSGRDLYASQLYVMELATRRSEIVSDSRGMLTSHPEWDPAGERLAYVIACDNDRCTGRADVAVVTWPEGTIDRIQTRRVELGPVRWSPDGAELLFAGYKGNSSDARLFRFYVASSRFSVAANKAIDYAGRWDW